MVLTQAALEEQVVTEFLAGVPTTQIEQAQDVASEIIGEWGNSPFNPGEIDSIDGVNFAIVQGRRFELPAWLPPKAALRNIHLEYPTVKYDSAFFPCSYVEYLDGVVPTVMSQRGR